MCSHSLLGSGLRVQTRPLDTAPRHPPQNSPVSHEVKQLGCRAKLFVPVYTAEEQISDLSEMLKKKHLDHHMHMT